MSDEVCTTKGDGALDCPPVLALLLVEVKTEAGEVPISKTMGSTTGILGKWSTKTNNLAIYY